MRLKEQKYKLILYIVRYNKCKIAFSNCSKHFPVLTLTF